jgi:hypothetical protein
MVIIDGYDVKKSTRENKKYDVFKDGKFIVSFGASGMQHYKDKIGLWSNLDHNDEDRLKSFRNRFKKLYEMNKNNKSSGIYWSWRFLW